MNAGFAKAVLAVKFNSQARKRIRSGHTRHCVPVSPLRVRPYEPPGRVA